MNPHVLAEELVKLSAEYSLMSEEFAKIEQRRPFAWSEIRATAKSVKDADMAYDMTEDGQRRIYLRHIMAASEKRQSAIKNQLRVYENEARGTY